MIKEAKISSIVSLFPLPQYVVVLEDLERTRLVPIWIGIHEGNAITLQMQGEKFPRPLTHDLIVNSFKTLGAGLEKIIISDLKDNSYYAILMVRHDGKVFEIDARPSDALALAVRVKCPIFIDEKVLKKCPKIDQSITGEEIEKFKTALKSMTPEEFFKNLEEAPLDLLPPESADDEDDEDDEEEDDEKEGGRDA